GHGTLVVVMCAICFTQLAQHFTLQVEIHHLRQIDQKPTKGLLIWTNHSDLPLLIGLSRVAGCTSTELLLIELEELFTGFIFEVEKNFDEVCVFLSESQFLGGAKVSTSAVKVNQSAKE